MLQLSFGPNTLPQETLDEITMMGNFALQHYLDTFGGALTDLDPCYMTFPTVGDSPGRYGAASDQEHLDVLFIRDDAFIDGVLTERGKDTVMHEFIHFCQYATDFERSYDVPYRQRPQEAQAFDNSMAFLKAYEESLMPAVEPEEDEDEPMVINTPVPARNSSRRIWVLLGALAVVLFLGSTVFAKAECGPSMDIRLEADKGENAYSYLGGRVGHESYNTYDDIRNDVRDQDNNSISLTFNIPLGEDYCTEQEFATWQRDKAYAERARLDNIEKRLRLCKAYGKDHALLEGQCK